MSFDHFYMTGLGVMAYGAIYLPFALFVLWLVYRSILSRLPQLWLRRVLVVASSAVIVTVPLWDVYAIGQEAKRLCKEQAGLHVYKTAEADGFIGGGIGYWSKYGFTYTETGGRGGKKLRYRMKNGEEIHEEVPEYSSRYQLQTATDARVISRHFSRNSDRVIDRQTKEVLGELVTVFIYPGWLDSVAIGVTGTGSGFSPWRCGREQQSGISELRNSDHDVVVSTLKPNRRLEGGTK